MSSGKGFTFIFDLGDTLIDDPFETVLGDPGLRQDLRRRHEFLAEETVCDAFLANWRIANREIDFPFASHFAQEEPWIQAALRAAVPALKDPASVGPDLLSLYRARVADVVARQTQLPVLRDVMQWLRATGAAVWVASNDRAFATPSLLAWAGLDVYVDRIFVSESLSRTYPKAEKPNFEYFKAIVSAGGLDEANLARAVHIGDSELRDIAPARALGMTTVRYRAPTAGRAATWRDNAEVTAAHYAYSDRTLLKPILAQILDRT